MMLLERWAIAALLGLGVASVVVATGQSPAAKTQQKQAQPAPELPPWDSSQPPPPIRPPSPEDAAAPPDDDQSPLPDDSPKPPEATQPPPPQHPVQQEAARPAPPADLAPQEEGPTLPPASDPAQRRMEKDTAELLRLVRELKAEVNKAGSNTLSVVAVHKADEIQRLAKSLKEQMRERGLLVVNKP
jgi:hypothetical protein